MINSRGFLYFVLFLKSSEELKQANSLNLLFLNFKNPYF